MIVLLGGKCRACGSTNKLEFHHRYYAEDSVKDGHALARLLEAQRHPKRFALFCKDCHNLIHSKVAYMREKTGMTHRIRVALKWSRRPSPEIESRLEYEHEEERDWQGLTPLERTIEGYVGGSKRRRDALMRELDRRESFV
jgi:hypothetical protein